MLPEVPGPHQRFHTFFHFSDCAQSLVAQRAPACHTGRKTRPQPGPCRIWSGKRDSNSRPQPWQGCALPTELFPQILRPASKERYCVQIPSRRQQSSHDAITALSRASGRHTRTDRSAWARPWNSSTIAPVSGARPTSSSHVPGLSPHTSATATLAPLDDTPFAGATGHAGHVRSGSRRCACPLQPRLGDGGRANEKRPLPGAFFLIWSGKRDSNSRPQPWQGCALPTELFPQISFDLRRRSAIVSILLHGVNRNFRRACDAAPGAGFAASITKNAPFRERFS